MNGAGAPLCSEMVSRVHRDLLFLLGWGTCRGWPVANFHSAQAYTTFLKKKGQANKQSIPAFPELNNRSLADVLPTKTQNPFQLLEGWGRARHEWEGSQSAPES